MDIKSCNNQISTNSFKGALNNKVLLKGLETISDHSATFIAATSAAMAVGVRPIAIALTPKTEKRNKEYAAANSIASGLIKFGIAEAIALPVEHAIKNIDKTPSEFLNKDTIKNLQGNADNIIKSKDYGILTQIIKQETGFISAIPKSMLTVALIPVIMDRLFPLKNKKQEKQMSFETPKVFENINIEQSSQSFKGSITNLAEKGVSGIINNKSVQNFIKKHNFNETNIARNMSIATDLLLTGSFIHRTNKSKTIEQNRKKALIYNELISLGTFLALGCGIDKMAQKGSQNFINKFIQSNKNNPNLNKYIQGLNIARSTTIFAGVYYILLPIFSTFMADKLDKLNKDKKN